MKELKSLPRIFGIISGSLSLFRLLTYLLDFDISSIVQSILDLYNKVLEPLRLIFGPLLELIAEEFHFDVPEWWPHFLVIWLLLGAITLRAGSAIDIKTGQNEKRNFLVDFILDLISVFLGGILLVFMIFAWIRHAIMMKILEIETYENPKYVNPFRILLKETLLTISTTLVFFALDAFIN